MKTLLTSSLLLLIVSISFAQGPIKQGTFNLGGTLSFSSQSSDEDYNDFETILLNPQVGYFFVNNFSLGLSIIYQKVSVDENSESDWGIGPNARYYFVFDKVNPFLGIGYSYAETSRGSSNYKITSDKIIFNGGLEIFITNSVAIETLLSYMINEIKYPEANLSGKDLILKSKTIYFGVGLNIFI